MLLIEPPPDIGLPHPVGDVLQIVVGEHEPGPHRSGLGEVEHLGGGDPAACQGEQLGRHRQQGVGLDQGAVGQPDPKPVRGMAAGHHFTQPEVRRDQRRVGLDIRTHHQNVARFQGVIVGEQAQQHLA